MLRHIFSFASLAVIHTGVVGGFAHFYSGHSSPATTAATSFGLGVAGILSGAFAGHHIHDKHNTSNKNTGATICGATGYAIGSIAGYFIR